MTGGSSGIGRCVAQTLARDGCDVAIFYQGSPSDGDPVVEKIESFDRRSRSFVGDVRNADQVNSAIETLTRDWGGLEIVINNAGIFRDQVIWKMSDEQWNDVIDVNLTGMFHVCRAAAPVLRKGGWGAVVNISSINGLRGKFSQTNYSASKAGVIGFTKALAKELARFHVTVNAVAPGMIETPILDAMSDQAKQNAFDEILMGGPGQVEDVAELVAFLCSDKARFITGEVVRVDGGQYI